MKNLFRTLIGFTMAALLIAAPVYAKNDDNENKRGAQNNGTTLEVRINEDGKVLVRGAKVTAVSANIISATTVFGASTIAWSIDATDTQKIIRRYGGNSSVSEIQIGDYISFTGQLTGATSPNFTVKATSIKDWSIQVKNSSFSGTISSISGSSFVLATEGRTITVNTDSNTKIMKGDAIVAFSTLVVGDKINKTEGLYNSNTNTLLAKSVRVYIDPLLSKRTFEGKLQSVIGATLPTTFTMTSEGKVYTVNVPTGISILNKEWMQIALSTFQLNDTVRVYGQIQPSNTSVIDATVVRNASR